MTSLKLSNSASVVTSTHFLIGSQELQEALSHTAQQQAQAAEQAIHEALSELEELRHLEVDWDSYGGNPPTAQALIAGEVLLKSVQLALGRYAGSRLAPEYIAPRADGGIHIEWGHRPLKVSIQVTASAGFAYLVVSWKNGIRDPREKSDVSLDEVIQEIARVVLES